MALPRGSSPGWRPRSCWSTRGRVGDLPGFAEGLRVGAGCGRAAGLRAARGAAGRARARCLRGPGRQDRRAAGGCRASALELTAVDIDAAPPGADRRESCRACVAHARLVTADLRTRSALVGRGAVRSHPARCAVFGYRRDPAPSGHQAVAPAGRHRRRLRPRSVGCSSGASRCCGPADGCCIRPARCCRRRTMRVVEAVLAANPRARRPMRVRWPGRAAAVCRARTGCSCLPGTGR